MEPVGDVSIDFQSAQFSLYISDKIYVAYFMYPTFLLHPSISAKSETMDIFQIQTTYNSI